MTKTRLFLCSALLAAALLPFNGFADGKPGEPGKSCPNGGQKAPYAQKMFAELGLTSEQEAKLKDIYTKSAPVRKLHFKQVEVQRDKIKLELAKEKPSKKVLDKHAAEMGKLHRQMNEAAISDLLKVKAVLTPEQFEKLSARGFMGGPEGMKMRMRGGEGRGDGSFAHKRGGHGYGHGKQYGPGKHGGPGDHRGKHKYKDGDRDEGGRGMCEPENCRHKCRFKDGSQAVPAVPIAPLPEGGVGE